MPLPPDSRWAQSPTFRTDSPDPNEKFKFKGQAQQDRVCLEVFHDLQGGYFVDLAAHKWREGSNTYNLEYFNKWQGVCIEANPKDLLGLLGNRRCSVYVNPVGATTGEKMLFEFRDHERHKKSKMGGAFGSLVGADFANTDNSTAVAVWTVSLSDILDHANAPATIEYLSLDIEGAEYFALKNFPFDRRKFLMITAERPSRQLHHLLVRNGYIFAAEITRLLGINENFGEVLYLHHTINNLGAHMEKWHHAENPPTFYGQVKPYLQHPQWTGSKDEYLSQGREAGLEDPHGPGGGGVGGGRHRASPHRQGPGAGAGAGAGAEGGIVR